MRITRELLVEGRSGSGGWNARQLKLLGIDWPPAQGWQDRVIGRDISSGDAEKFVLLKRSLHSPKKTKEAGQEPSSEFIRGPLYVQSSKQEVPFHAD